MMDQASQKLQAAQDRLSAQGAQSVRFCFDAGVTRYPLSEVKESVARVLHAHCDGKLSALGSIDSQRA